MVTTLAFGPVCVLCGVGHRSVRLLDHDAGPLDERPAGVENEPTAAPMPRPSRGAQVTANMILVVEREYPFARDDVFDAWTIPEQMSQWRGSPGWHVDPSTVTSELKAGGRHHHDKVRESDGHVVSTDAVFTEYIRPDVFVAKQRITGDEGINPEVPLELRVEFTKMGKRGTLVRVVQGPYDPEEAKDHSTGWEAEMQRLADWLNTNRTPVPGTGGRA